MTTTGPTAGAGDDPLDIEGPAAPPRANGELVFTAPWQSRLFATTMRLHETGRIEWETFRQGLIAQIADHEQAIGDTQAADEQSDYWGCWQRALEALLDQVELVSTSALSTTAGQLAARPPGHDHDHGDHGHGDGHNHDHNHGDHHH